MRVTSGSPPRSRRRELVHIPNHLADKDFPLTAEELADYAVVMLSDIGSNTLLLHPDTFAKSESKPNRLDAIRHYVARGGGLVMVGGYLTFQGIDAKARYAGTAVEDALPVTMLTCDDRVERPEGVEPSIKDKAHPVVAGLPDRWPALLGYNRIVPKPGATLVAVAGDDPLVVCWGFGNGRAVAFAADCGPHWAPPGFVEWDGYAKLWGQLVSWAADASKG